MSRLQCLLLVACAMIGGCSAPPTSRADLLSESYRNIGRYYLEPVRTDKVSEASLAGLATLDPDITIEARRRALLLKRGSDPIARFPAPAPNDWQAWGEATDRVTAAAVAASPVIAQVPEDTLDEALLDGAISALDPYSHYLSPQAAGQSVIVEDERVLLDVGGGAPAHGASGARFPGKLLPPASVSLSTDGDFAVIHISRFTTATVHLMRQALAHASAASGRPPGIILDLRDDPGGQISTAAEVADLFLDHGMVAELEGRDPRDQQTFDAYADNSPYERIPMVVVVNGRSASAAELLAAALQGNGRALVVGTLTYGKGTSQRIIRLVNGGELWLSSAWMRTPAGYLLQGRGVAPDICTDLTPDNAFADTGRAVLRQRYRSLTSRPRISLSEAEWSELRRLCPPTGRPGADDEQLQVAKQVLSHQIGLRQ